MEKLIEGFPHYKIDEEGNVFSNFKTKDGVTWIPLKNVLDKGVGYYLVTLYREGKPRANQFIHRLLSVAFHPNPDNKPHVNHIDGDKTNNALSNLEWATYKENSQHAVDMGLTTYTHCEVAIIQCNLETHEEIQEFKSLHEAGRFTGVAYQNISKVVRGIRTNAGGYYWKYK